MARTGIVETPGLALAGLSLILGPGQLLVLVILVLLILILVLSPHEKPASFPFQIPTASSKL